MWWTLHRLGAGYPGYLVRTDSSRSGPQRASLAHSPRLATHPVPGVPATLRLEEISRTYDDDAATEEHITTIGLNNSLLTTETWGGKQRRIFTVTAPAGLLTSGLNTLTVGACRISPAAPLPRRSTRPAIALPVDDWLATTDGDPMSALRIAGATNDDIYVNYWEVDYRRLFQASLGQLDFAAESIGPQEFLTHGWSTAVTVVGTSPTRSCPARPGRCPRPAAFRSASVQMRPRALASGCRKKRRSTLPRPAPTATANRAAYTRGRGRCSHRHVRRPAPRRRNAGRLAPWSAGVALVVDFQDARRRVQRGHLPSQSRTCDVRRANPVMAPAPHYLTLFGDGHWNFKGYNPARYYAGPLHDPALPGLGRSLAGRGAVGHPLRRHQWRQPARDRGGAHLGRPPRRCYRRRQ